VPEQREKRHGGCLLECPGRGMGFG
jgi:hypothetical protein